MYAFPVRFVSGLQVRRGERVAVKPGNMGQMKKTADGQANVARGPFLPGCSHRRVAGWIYKGQQRRTSRPYSNLRVNEVKRRLAVARGSRRTRSPVFHVRQRLLGRTVSPHLLTP